jgi:hypothetical protein
MWVPHFPRALCAKGILLTPTLTTSSFPSLSDIPSPLPLRSNGIIELAENRQEIYAAQYFTGKILKTLELSCPEFSVIFFVVSLKILILKP